MNYFNEWIREGPVNSQNGKYLAEVYCKHDVQNIDIFIIIHNKNGMEISRKKIITELPDEFAYAEHLGELKWLSDSSVVLINKDKKWDISL